VYPLALGSLTDTLLDRALNPSLAAEYGSQIAGGLAHMHVHGVAHLDLKAENMLLYSRSGVTFPMLTDYGLAMQFTPGRLERPSVGRGTRPYMSPEILQATGEKTDISKIDVYAFGCLLWEILAGKLPWDDLFAGCGGDHAVWEHTLSERVLSGERPDMDDSWPALLRALMEQCWARAAGARPAMLSVQATLATGVSSGGASAHRSTRTSARSGLGSHAGTGSGSAAASFRTSARSGLGSRGGAREVRADAAPPLTSSRVSSPSKAAFEEGERCSGGYSKGVDRARAVKYFQHAADGYAPAAAALAFHYRNGLGVAKDEAESQRLCLKALEMGLHELAEKGEAAAQYWHSMGTMDAREGARWCRLAAEQGYARAQLKLGECHQAGDGAPRDQREAARLFRLAADQGLVGAQNNFGACCAKGDGVPMNKREAIRYLRLAAEQGDSCAQYNLGASYYNGDGVSRDKREGIRLFRLSGEQGYPLTQNFNAIIARKDFRAWESASSST
jgi:TPR repeat protein